MIINYVRILSLHALFFWINCRKHTHHFGQLSHCLMLKQSPQSCTRQEKESHSFGTNGAARGLEQGEKGKWRRDESTGFVFT